MAKRKKSSPIRQLLSPTRIFIAIGFGLLAAGYSLYREFDLEKIIALPWGRGMAFFLFLGLVMVVVRDLGYMARLRVMSEGEISWRNCFDVIMLWEFASAISPSVVGGSGVAVFIVNKEGIKLGKSAALVMITALLDELFYIIMVPLVFLITGTGLLFPVELNKTIAGVELGTFGIFVAGYIFIVILTSIILLGIFISPRGFKNILVRIFSLSFLKRWQESARETGDELIYASTEYKGKGIGFWAKAFGATLFSWTARFWVVNMLIMAIAAVTMNEHLLIYARQLVMWVIMLISPTPGGAGIAELAFDGFLGTFIPLGLAGSVALLWRIYTYYPYLFIGAIILPRWIRRVYLKRNLIRFKTPTK